MLGLIHTIHLVIPCTCRVQASRGTVLAAGAWSADLLAAATGDGGWSARLRPRRGHLLEVPLELLGPGFVPPVRGIMETGYTTVRAVSLQFCVFTTLAGSMSCQVFRH